MAQQAGPFAASSVRTFAHLSPVRLYRAAWVALFTLLPLGNTSLGWLMLLIATAWAYGQARLQGVPCSEVAAQGGLIASSPLYRRVRLALLVLLGAMVLSAAGSPDRPIAFAATAGYALAFATIVPGAAQLAADWAFLYLRLLPALTLASAVSAAYTIFSYFGLGYVRAEAPFISYSGTGTLLVLSTALGLGWLESRRLWKVWPLYLVLMGMAVAVTFTRGAWIAFIAMLLTYALRNRKVLTAGLLILVGLTLVMSLSPALRTEALDRLNDYDTGRFTIWRSILDMIREYPLFGVGVGVHPVVYPQFQLPNGVVDAGHAHNLLLAAAADLGLPAAGLYAGLLLWFGWLGWKTSRSSRPGDRQAASLSAALLAAYVGVLVHQMVDLPIYGVESGVAFWTVVGLMIGLACSTTATEPAAAPSSSQKNSP